MWIPSGLTKTTEHPSEGSGWDRTKLGTYDCFHTLGGPFRFGVCIRAPDFWKLPYCVLVQMKPTPLREFGVSDSVQLSDERGLALSAQMESCMQQAWRL